MSKKKKAANTIPGPTVCCFCQKPSDEKRIGKFFISEQGFAVHQYCMFFSANLPQNGKDEEGFEGFLEEDILAEYRRAKRMRCNICRQTGASAGCFKATCKRSFHYSCGAENQYLFQFFGEFRAFCVDHRPHQKTRTLMSSEIKTKCVICLEDVHCRSSPDVLRAPCCRNTWFHKTCIQEQATVSGYFFRCAVCNDAEKFRKEMRFMGVYIPDRDAAWEEGGNFADLLEKYERCDTLPCQCPSGNTFSKESGPWEIVLCNSCGQYGSHVRCKQWAVRPASFYCPACRSVHGNDDGAVTRSFGNVSTAPELVDITEEKRRKPRMRLKKKRPREDSDDEDLTTILCGLTRQENEDFLDLDTRLVVQRALAAGKAATRDSFACSSTSVLKGTPDRTGHSSTSVDTPSMSYRARATPTNNTSSTVFDASGSTLFQTRSRPNDTHDPVFQASSKPVRFLSVLDSSRKETADDDDDCVITKYIPGTSPCKYCPKCNRPKPLKKIRREKPAAVATSTVVAPTSSPRKLSESDDSQAPFMVSLESPNPGVNQASPIINEKGFETIERAAEQTNKTSVWLVPQMDVTGKSSSKIKTEDTSRSAIKLPETVEDIMQSVTSQTNVSLANSIWMNSVEKIIQLLNPRSSPSTRGNVTSSPNNLASSSPKSSPILFSPSPSTSCDATPENVQSRVDRETGRLPKREIEEHSDNQANVSSDKEFERSRVTRSKTRLVFSRSDPEKTVLEAAMDHAYKLRSSGKEMTHQCLTSF